MNAEIKILFSAEHPGSFNAIWPVIEKLKKDKGIEPEVFLAGNSCAMAEKKNTKYTNASNFLDDKEIKRYLSAIKPDIIIVSNSADNFKLTIEKKVISWAKDQGIPTISLIDYWGYYVERFSNPKQEDLAYTTDIIGIIDEPMKREMLKYQFDESALHIVGNPFFETFSSIPQRLGKYIIFVSQPFSEIYSSSEIKNNPLLFDEISLFQDYVKVFEKLDVSSPILIKLHPRSQNNKKFKEIIDNTNLNISITNEELSELFKKAKIFTGINTMALFEASLRGVPTVSYQPGIKEKNDPLMSNQLGLSRPAYDFGELQKSLSAALFSTKMFSQKLETVRNLYVNSKASEKVIMLIEKLTSSSL